MVFSPPGRLFCTSDMSNRINAGCFHRLVCGKCQRQITRGFSVAPLHYGAAGKQWADFLPRTHRSPVKPGVLTQSIKTHSYGPRKQGDRTVCTTIHYAPPHRPPSLLFRRLRPSLRSPQNGWMQREGRREGRKGEERRGGVEK